MLRHVRTVCKAVGNVEQAARETAENRADALEAALDEQKQIAKVQQEKLEELERRLNAGGAAVTKTEPGELTPEGGGGGVKIGGNANIKVDNSVTSTTTNNIVQNNTKIEVNVFGGERTDYILKEEVVALLVGASSVEEVIAGLGLRVWNDAAHPENATLRLQNVKGDRVEVRTADGGTRVLGKGAAYPRMHRILTNLAYANQPYLEKEAQAADATLKALDAIDKGEAALPVREYDGIAIGCRKIWAQ